MIRVVEKPVSERPVKRTEWRIGDFNIPYLDQWNQAEFLKRLATGIEEGSVDTCVAFVGKQSAQRRAAAATHTANDVCSEALLGWTGGHDAQVVDLYRTLSGDHPDYVLEATGQTYRQLKQPDNAYVVYAQGMQKYPDSVTFTEGTIRSLVDQKKYGDALKMANDDLKLHGNRPEIVDIKKNILRLMPHKKVAHTSRHHHH